MAGFVERIELWLGLYDFQVLNYGWVCMIFR